MDQIKLGSVRCSRFLLGGNPFSGFSHQNPALDRRMKSYFTAARIKQTLREAEALGVDSVVARTDHHIMRVLLEYWDEGGKIQWLAQTCPELKTHQAAVDRAVHGGARACHIHGGVMDMAVAQGRHDEIQPMVDAIRKSGMPAGIAGHNPRVFEWADKHLDVDYYMCCYYNSANRDKRAEHVSGMAEWFHDGDRQAMTALIPSLSRPVIHYKILAAGRNDPAEAFAYAARIMRPGDAVCVGIYQEDQPDMLKQDVELFERSLQRPA